MIRHFYKRFLVQIITTDYCIRPLNLNYNVKNKQIITQARNTIPNNNLH